MQVGYLGDLQGIYENSQEKYEVLAQELRENQVRVLVCENAMDWVKDACREMEITLIEVVFI